MEGVFAVGGGVLEAVVEVVEDYAVFGHHAERGRHVFIQRVAGEGLGTDVDEVIPAEQACHVVPAGGLHRGQVVAEGLYILVVRLGGKVREVYGADLVGELPGVYGIAVVPLVGYDRL